MKVLFAFCILIVLSQANLAASICWLSAYTRDFGKTPTGCRPGLDKVGSVCCPQCQIGYQGVGNTCWQSCPNGFRDDGFTCAKPSSYNRGTGYVAWQRDKCERENAYGCEKHGLSWYPKCLPGYKANGCCYCSPVCKDGQVDNGSSCAKKSYMRIAENPTSCSNGMIQEGNLCYSQCTESYHGVGPLCVESCPKGYEKCGALCVQGQSCIGKVAEIGQEALKLGQDVAAKGDLGITLILAKVDGFNYPVCHALN